MRPAGFEPATKGFKASPAFPRGLDYLTLPAAVGPLVAGLDVEGEAGRSSAGVIVGTHPASL